MVKTICGASSKSGGIAIVKAGAPLLVSSAFDNANHHVIDHLGLSALMNPIWLSESPAGFSHFVVAVWLTYCRQYSSLVSAGGHRRKFQLIHSFLGCLAVD